VVVAAAAVVVVVDVWWWKKEEEDRRRRWLCKVVSLPLRLMKKIFPAPADTRSGGFEKGKQPLTIAGKRTQTLVVHPATQATTD
jgi:hypothetical protein